MQPQGTAVSNTAYIDQLATDIGRIDGCAELQKLVGSVMATLQAEVAAIEAQLAALLPIIKIPGSLGEVIAWITHFSAPQSAAFANLTTQLTQMLAAIARLTTAIEAAANKLTHCSITVPPVVAAAGAGTPEVTVGGLY